MSDDARSSSLAGVAVPGVVRALLKAEMPCKEQTKMGGEGYGAGTTKTERGAG